MRHAQIGAYQAVQTTTAEPARLVVELFDGATRFLHQARQGLDRGDTGAFAYWTTRAQAIIVELAGALNHEAGGEVSVNLARLYDFMLRHLMEGLVEKSPAHLTRTLALLRTLREAFEAAGESRGNAAPATPRHP